MRLVTETCAVISISNVDLCRACLGRATHYNRLQGEAEWIPQGGAAAV